MIFPVFPRFKLALAFVCVLMLAACSHTPKASFRPPPPLGNGYPERIEVRPPSAQEVIVVINDNVRMLHAGMFAADTLLDPAGSYTDVRSVEPGWPGPSLQDYVRFQLEDGPDVKLYRFVLSAEEFAQVAGDVRDGRGIGRTQIEEENGGLGHAARKRWSFRGGKSTGAAGWPVGRNGLL